MDKEEIIKELGNISDNLLYIFKQIKVLNFGENQFNYQTDTDLADVVDYLVRSAKEIEKLTYTQY